MAAPPASCSDAVLAKFEVSNFRFYEALPCLRLSNSASVRRAGDCCCVPAWA